MPQKRIINGLTAIAIAVVVLAIGQWNTHRVVDEAIARHDRQVAEYWRGKLNPIYHDFGLPSVEEGTTVDAVFEPLFRAMTIPHSTNASIQARQSSLSSQLQTLRSQIELYKLQHGDTLPNLTTATGSWSPLTGATIHGNPAVTYGPYLQTVPSNPLNGKSNVLDGTGAASASSDCGFVYDYNSGNGTGKLFGTDTDGVSITSY